MHTNQSDQQCKILVVNQQHYNHYHPEIRRTTRYNLFSDLLRAYITRCTTENVWFIKYENHFVWFIKYENLVHLQLVSQLLKKYCVSSTFGSCSIIYLNFERVLLFIKLLRISQKSAINWCKWTKKM